MKILIFNRLIGIINSKPIEVFKNVGFMLAKFMAFAPVVKFVLYFSFKINSNGIQIARMSDLLMNSIKNTNIEIILNPYEKKINEAKLFKLIDDTVGLIAGTEQITEDELNLAKSLRTISRYGTKIDNIALDTTRKTGIKIFNCPNAPTKAVIELILSSVSTLIWHISVSSKSIKDILQIIKNRSDNAVIHHMDLLDIFSYKILVDLFISTFGRIDILINDGVGIYGFDV